MEKLLSWGLITSSELKWSFTPQHNKCGINFSIKQPMKFPSHIIQSCFTTCHRVSEPQHSLLGVVRSVSWVSLTVQNVTCLSKTFHPLEKSPNFHTSVTTAISICSGSRKIRILLPMTHELSDTYHGSEPAIGIAWNIIDRTDSD